MTQRADHISLSIDDEALANAISSSIRDELARLSPAPPERCIFRVYDELRIQNEKAYQPNIIAIGPYHHGKCELQEMEGHKRWYLQLLLQRRYETSVNEYIMAMSDMETRARKCYAEHINFSKGEFVKMMLLDGIFIIELFRKWNAESTHSNDPVLRFSRILDLCSDLLLLENQIPFFILDRLFNMTRDPRTNEDITCLALSFLSNVLPGQMARPYVSDIPMDGVKHLLHLVHGSMCFSFAAKVASYDRMSINEKKKFKFIFPITELQLAGIQFKVAEESNSLFDIKFEKGLMKIPQFFIHERTESILRNLIAYEQFLPDIHGTYVCDYALFIDCLVNTTKDAKFLRRHGIIENSLGDDIMVCNVLNKLAYGVSVGTNFSYLQVFDNVNMHCRSKYNFLITNLRETYFNGPWAFISFLAAAVLLLFTVGQTIFSILSYFNRS